jgi:hypothetical protein
MSERERRRLHNLGLMQDAFLEMRLEERRRKKAAERGRVIDLAQSRCLSVDEERQAFGSRTYGKIV